MKFDLSQIKFSLAMAIFGTIGIFVKLIALPSSMISMFRGILGSSFLIAFILIKQRGFSFKAVSKNLGFLLISGALIGFDWILLFDSYKYTSVARATLCYYMAPVILVLVSPLVFKEGITPKKGICVAVSLFGMILVSGIFDNISFQSGELRGIALSFFSAVIYAVIIILNKKLRDIDVFEQTVVQLLTCGIVMFIYSAVSGNMTVSGIGIKGLIVLIFVCIFHTGLAYLLYFGSMYRINAQSIAILSYIDPVVAVVLSSVFERPMSFKEIIGAVLIVCSAIAS